MNTFEKTKQIQIEELDCLLTEWKHRKTGAAIIHIGNKDPENLFCLSFQTVPKDSAGVAHILEHVVLAGSKKYPIKDPFFSMMRRSLNTYLNALTGADHTSFPAATQCKKDFYNLLEVYLDAVFYPKLERFSFLQEGIRLDFVDENNPDSPLVFKGIVFNEMKGALSSPSLRLHEAMNEALYPGAAYGVNSGGDPQAIQSLSYSGLKQFWQTFYTPEKCLFFFYGSFPIEDHLAYLEENFFSKIPSQVMTNEPLYQPLPLQVERRREKSYRTLHFPISSSEEENKTMVSFGWLTTKIEETIETLAMTVLSLVLMDNDSSPLKKALLGSGLVKQATCFFDTEIPDVPFVLTLKGVEKEKVDEIEALLFTTLKEIASKGIDKNEIERACHQLEFGKSEVGGDSAPFGLHLFFRAALLHHHGLPVEEGLQIHTLFDQLQDALGKNPRLLQEMVEKHLLHNNHFVRILFLPDLHLSKKEEEEEKKRLHDLAKALSKEDKRTILEENRALKEFQRAEESQDPSCLPTIGLEDIPKDGKEFSLKKAGNLYSHETFTNSILYLDHAIDLPMACQEDIELLRMMTLLITEIGTEKRSWQAWLSDLQGYTGGMGASLSLNVQAEDRNLFSPAFHIKGKALGRHQTKLLSMMEELLLYPSFEDGGRIQSLLNKKKTQVDHSIAQNALHYAMTSSSEGITGCSELSEKCFGLSWVRFLRKSVTEVPGLQKALKKLFARLMGEQKRVWIASGERAQLAPLSFPDKGASEAEPLWGGHFSPKKFSPQAFLISSPVAFSAHVLPTVSYTHPDAPKLLLAAHIMDNILLHRKIREEGGAYGGGAQAHTLSGAFSFYAYRDPHIAATFAAFREAIDLLAAGEFSEEDVQEAIFEAIQSFDAPVAPGSRGDTAYGWLREGKSNFYRQTFRKGILEAKKEGIAKAVFSHVLPNFSSGRPVIFTGQELIDKEKSAFTDLGFGDFTIDIP